MPIIEVSHLTKEYQLGHITSLKENVLNTFRRLGGKPIQQREDFKALDDVNFTIEEGEVVGIIGHNGAGKSTLLKHLANISKPTIGKVIVRGSVAPLIEVGAGVNPELTGRENIFLNGAILGIPKKIIQQKLDEIIDFSELEQFIDTPVKRYSSGMTVKLGFSIATSMEADILIIDEVLSVGDLAFQRKCFDRMEELIHKKNKTVLIVGHNIRQIERISSRMMLLEKGKITKDSSPKEVSNLYFSYTNKVIENNHLEGLNQFADTLGEIEMINVSLFQEPENKKTNEIVMGKLMRIQIEFNSKNEYKNSDIGIVFHTSDFVYLASSPLASNLDEPPTIKKGINVFNCVFEKIILLPGEFHLRIGIKDGQGLILWNSDNVAHFKVVPSKNINASRLSVLTLIQFDATWSFNAVRRDGPNCLNRHYQFISEYLSFY